jgi:ribonuclease HII
MMTVIGLDEVGRGCWAGPLVAAAVVLPGAHSIVGLNDSKKLSKKQRESLDLLIREKALGIGIGWVWPEDIDSGGITKAVKIAMLRAFAQLGAEYTGHYDEIIVDGNINYLANVSKSSAMIKADGSIPAVSAASIIAKVARDNYMADIASEYPQYGFAGHVGYGTAEHIAALRQYGVTAIHRRSYKPIRALLELQS